MENKTSNKQETKAMPYDALLATVNFCEMDNDKLFKLLDFLGQNEILEKSKMTEKYEDGKCIEKGWEWYDRLNVYPQKITATGHITVVILTAEKYVKMMQLFL